MTTIVTRAGKGSALTHTELDNNFTNLNTDKVEASGDSMTGDLSFGDNNKAVFGAGSDLQIYHDGTHSYIKDAGTGNFIIEAADYTILRGTNSNLLFAAQSGQGITGYYNGSVKLATTSTGVDVTGTVTADGLTIDNNSSTPVSINRDQAIDGYGIVLNQADTTDGNGLEISYQTTTTGTVTPNTLFAGIDFTADNHNWSTREGSIQLKTAKGGVGYKTRMNVAGTGDISFYEDTGTTAKFFWDASAESLLIGKTSSSFSTVGVEATGTGKIRATMASDNPISLNRTTTDGDIAIFAKDGSTVGSIGVRQSDLTIGNGDTGLQFYNFGNAIFPIDTSTVAARDAAIDLGVSNVRFKDLYLSGNVNAGGHIDAGDTYSLRWGNGNERITGVNTGNTLRFITNNAERARLDASGNLLVGTTAYQGGGGAGAKGFYAGADGLLSSARSSASVAVLNRTTSDGNIAEFRKDGTTVGSIGVASSNAYFGTGDTGIFTNASSDTIQPFNTSTGTVRDGLIDVGSSGARFKDLYLSGGVYLGGTGAANKLDDYEEGEHTVTLTTTTSGTITMDSAADLLQYTKIGRQVTVQGRVVVSSVSSPVGNVEVSLPFVVQNPSETSAQFTYQTVVNNCVSKNVNDFVIFGGDGSTKAILAIGSATSLSSASSEIQAGSVIYFSFSYITAA